MSTAFAIDAPVVNEPGLSRSLSRSVWKRRYERALRVSDVAVVSSAGALSQLLRFGSVPCREWLIFHLGLLVVSTVVAVIWVLFLTIYRTRAPKILGAGLEEYQRVSAATVSAFGAIAIASMLTK